MTDLLSTLLREDAETIDVPPADAGEVLRRGRARRRRGRAGSTVGALALVGVVAGTALIATRGDGGGRPEPADPPGEAADTGATFSVGTTLWYDDATRSVEIDDQAVKSLYYTSAGVLVRHGDNNWSDGGGEQRFSLVTPEGEVRPVGVVTEEVAHTTDPNRPYLAWAQATGDVVEVVVHDVAADEEVARVPLPDADPEAFLWTTLAGDTAQVRADGDTFRVDWRTGEVGPLDQVADDVGGGRALIGRDVVDLADGEVLWTATGTGSLDLSPDGRFVLHTARARGQETYRVSAVDPAAAPVSLPEPSERYAWTGGSELYSVAPDAVATCDPVTGACTDTPVDLGVDRAGFLDTVRLGGATYES